MDNVKDQQPGVYPIGLDLVYDRSVRDALSELGELAGEVVFSPFMFQKADLMGDLNSNRMSHEKLVGLGQLATKAIARF